MHGPGLLNIINDYIAAMASPKTADSGSAALSRLVGKANLGYITWNLLSGLKQVPPAGEGGVRKVIGLAAAGASNSKHQTFWLKRIWKRYI
jgi:hypothetical protein